MEYESTAHAKFLLLSHLIFVCTSRKRLLLASGAEVKLIFQEIAKQADFSFEVLEVDQDHLHCLVKSKPTLSPVAIVRRLKQASTKRLWDRHEAEWSHQSWKERTFWSDGYFCCTIGNASPTTIRQSIEQQG
jgi:putative transposase